MANQSVHAVFDDCRTLEDTKLFFHYNNAKKCFDTVVSENEPEGNASFVRLTIEDAAGINEYDNPTDASENFVKAKKNSCRCRYRNYRKDVQSNYAFRKQFATGSFLCIRKRQSLQRNTRCEKNVRCQKRSSHKREMP